MQRTREGALGKTRAARVVAASGLLVLAIAMALAASSPAASPRGLEWAIQVQEANSDRLLERGNVVGTGVGRDSAGAPEVIVLARRPIRVADSLNGVPVELKVTGPISSLGLGVRPDKRPESPGKGNGGGGGETESFSTTARLDRPVPIGVSTGNAGECSAGTIGARVIDGEGDYFALSNNHVYALENKAKIGSILLQPGRYDTGCAWSEKDAIGTLAAFEPISYTEANEIDAALAALDSVGEPAKPVVGNSTPANGYGTPSAETAVGVGPVKKYGRTTQETHGYAYAINGIVNVGYSGGTARFVNQVFVEGQRGPFLKAGDSGSLLVSESGAHPVGLLFAGDNSGKFAVANNIDTVLARFGVAIDGQ